MFKPIVLNWKGPIRFSDIKDYNSLMVNYGDIQNDGVYIFCVKIDNKPETYAVVNVGKSESPKKSSNIYKRLSAWYDCIQNGWGTFIKQDNFIDNILTGDLELEYGGGPKNYGCYKIEHISDDLRKFNLNCTYIFYCVIDKEVKQTITKELSNEISTPIEQLEGSLKNLLSRKMNTRKYYISLEYPRYTLHDSKILNIVQNNSKILGFNI
jgi:hypothetical protein